MKTQWAHEQNTACFVYIYFIYVLFVHIFVFQLVPWGMQSEFCFQNALLMAGAKQFESG